MSNGKILHGPQKSSTCSHCRQGRLYFLPDATSRTGENTIMVPLKLQLRNFMCYRGSNNSIDFSHIHLACLAGDNGHGKSALLDAMTWALWGKARARRDDDLITHGETEMEVHF